MPAHLKHDWRCFRSCCSFQFAKFYNFVSCDLIQLALIRPEDLAALKIKIEDTTTTIGCSFHFSYLGVDFFSVKISISLLCATLTGAIVASNCEALSLHPQKFPETALLLCWVTRDFSSFSKSTFLMQFSLLDWLSWWTLPLLATTNDFIFTNLNWIAVILSRF